MGNYIKMRTCPPVLAVELNSTFCFSRENQSYGYFIILKMGGEGDIGITVTPL